MWPTWYPKNAPVSLTSVAVTVAWGVVCGRVAWRRFLGLNSTQMRHLTLRGVYAEHWIGDVEQVSLPVDMEPFDCIVFADVLEHLRDPWGTMEQYLQRLKPGGYVVASIPNVRNFYLLYNLIVRGQWRYEDSGLLDRTHLRFFTRKEIMELFSVAGLEVEMVSENRERFSLKRRIFAAPLLALIPDLGVCQYFNPCPL